MITVKLQSVMRPDLKTVTNLDRVFVGEYLSILWTRSQSFPYIYPKKWWKVREIITDNHQETIP